MTQVIEDCEVVVKLKLCIDGKVVEIELDRENAERLQAKLAEALPQSAAPTYVPCPYPVYTPPVWVRPRPFWERPVVTWRDSGTAVRGLTAGQDVSPLTTGCIYRATVGD